MASYSNYGPKDTPEVSTGDVGFARINNRLRPDQLKPGEVVESINGRMDINGAWQVRKGVNAYGSALTASVRSLQLTSPPRWKLYAGTNAIASATRTGATVTIDTTGAHGYSSDTLVYVSGLTGTVDPNGNRLITVTDTDTFTFTITGAVGNETYTGSGTAEPAELSGDVVDGVFGSCIYSNPNEVNVNKIVRATNLFAVCTCLESGTETEVAYPTGITITSPVDMLQVFDKVLILRRGATALEWNGSITGSPAFTKVSEGAFTQPTYLDSSNNTAIADGVATVTQTGAHGLSAGDQVYVVDNGSTLLTEGIPYTVVSAPTGAVFTVNAQVPDASATTVVWSRRISQGKGFIHMPAPEWGTYHQGRLWVPYEYNPSASGPVARNVTDEIIASDILDYNTYDVLENQFRITKGTHDHVEGLFPFAEDNLLVFNRRSIYLVQGVSGELTDTDVKLVTPEIGCVARKSIVQVGNEILFLSDNGVYAAAFGDLYNLRGAGVPLSEPIKATIDRINKAAANLAVACYFNNRYYLAVALDGSTKNNALLIYNFLNKGWESVDTNRSGWDIQNLLVASSEETGSGIGKIYTVSSNGSIHLLDAREDGNDLISINPGVAANAYPITSSVTTRQYNMGSIDRKVFTDYEIHMESSDSESSDASIAVAVENYDYEATLTSIATLNGGNLAVGEDASLRGRIGNKRGYGIQMTITPTNGRPSLQAVKINAKAANAAVSQAT